jgi:hypothetical protein
MVMYVFDFQVCGRRGLFDAHISRRPVGRLRPAARRWQSPPPGVAVAVNSDAPLPSPLGTAASSVETLPPALGAVLRVDAVDGTHLDGALV